MSKIRLNVLLCLQAVVKVSTIYLHMGTSDSQTLPLLYGMQGGKMKQIMCSDYLFVKKACWVCLAYLEMYASFL